MMDIKEYPKNNWERFKQVLDRGFSLELFKGLGITFKIMKGVIFNNESHNTKYPIEKLPISPRYRAVHKLLALLESGTIDVLDVDFVKKFVSQIVFEWIQNR